MVKAIVLTRLRMLFAVSLFLTVCGCMQTARSGLQNSAAQPSGIVGIDAEMAPSRGRVVRNGTTFFENKVSADKLARTVRAVSDFKGSRFLPSDRTDDTERVQRAIYQVSQIDRDADGNPEGGVVYLKRSETGNTFRLARLEVFSNVRIIVDPDLTLVMIGSDVPKRQANGAPVRDENGQIKTQKNDRIFTIGVSESVNQLIKTPVQNVEIISAHPGEKFTIDQRSEFPLEYKSRLPGELRANGPVVEETPAQEYGVASVYATPFAIGYARNVAISDAHVLDNFTYLPSIMIYPDSNGQDGVQDAIRYSGEPTVDAMGKRLESGMLIDADGNKVRDLESYERNPTYDRTLEQGAFHNLSSDRGHGGFGLFQVWGGKKILVDGLHGDGGITVRLEPGAGVENISRSGPKYGAIENIHIRNISVRDGYAALWMNPHSKDNRNIFVHNVSAYDSGAAIIIDKSNQDTERYPDLHAGSFANVDVSGRVHFARESSYPRAEVGFIPTLLMHPDDILALADSDGQDVDGRRSGQPDGRITLTDLPAGPSGDRWFLVDPIVPIMALDQRSVVDGKSPQPGTLTSALDLSKAYFTRTDVYPITHRANVLDRNSMRRISDAEPALEWINDR